MSDADFHPRNADGSQDVAAPEHAAMPQNSAAPENVIDPGLDRVLRSTPRFDARLTAAMHELAVPEGLASRLLARLTEARMAEARVAAEIPAPMLVEPASSGPFASAIEMSGDASLPAGAEATKELAPAPVRFSRRRMAIYGSALAASLLATVGASLWGWHAGPGVRDMPEEAVAWFRQLPADWQPLEKVPRGWSLPSSLPLAATGWQYFLRDPADRGSAAGRGVAFHLAAARGRQAGGAEAVLFVLPGTRPGVAAGLPRLPQSSTAGLAIGVWQSAGRTYVLVVRGGERDYRQFVQPGAPLA